MKEDSSGDDVEVEKSNVMLVGPTGCGKTLLAQTLARFLNVPFAIGDATTLTQAGYVGEDVENLLLRLIQAADWDVAAAEQGIIYLDEIDKIGRTTLNISITRDVSGEGVQQALLKMLEGTVANVPPQGGRKHPEQHYIQINTGNILFICGGTFVGLENIVRERVGKKAIGFGRPVTDETKELGELLAQVGDEDLIKYGMIPELVGRLPVTVALGPLDQEALVRILLEPKNALVKQYQKIFRMEGAKLEFRRDALEEVAGLALGITALHIVRLYLAFAAIGNPVSLAGCVLVAAVAAIAVFISVTPAGLGVREAAILVAAMVMGVTPEVSLLAAAAHRAVGMLVVLSIGPVATLILSREAQKASPPDD